MSTQDFPFIEHLNPEQRKAVFVTKQHLRVLAGAGSGKTQVLVCRIAWLMQAEHLFPSRFLAVTFTNKAANEMRSRLSGFMQGSPHALWVGTFHHLAHRILRQHYELAGLSRDFQIMDSSDQQRRIKRVIRSMKLDEARFTPKSVQGFINQQKDSASRSNAFEATGFTDPYQKVLINIYHEYEASCEKDHVLDFSDLLLRSLQVLEKNPDILAHYHARFRYILVDEFQDTNHIQYDWIRLLTGPETYLTIVGDDDQSIYGWRGAQIENMHHFERDFPNSQTIRLEQNYRSTNTILSAANKLIANNQQRLGKNLWTAGDPGDAIQIYPAFTDLDEARFIVERIQMAHEEGIDYQDIALLYRSNAQSRVLEEALLYANIPYRIYGGLRFFERAEIKDTVAYLRLISQSDDNGAFERIINTPARGIGEKTLEVIRATAKEESISYYEASERLLTAAALPTRGANALKSFIYLIRDLRQRIQDYSLDMKIEYVVEASGLIEQYKKEPADIGQARIENVNELIYAARQFVPDTEEEDSLSGFLSKMALDIGEHQAETANAQGVQLMTLHAAKGLEFPIVFLTGLEEGLFPSHLSLNKPSDVEEERRLCYVGMTRAMKQLYLTYAEVRAHHGAESYRIPSRFIEEIPSEYTAYIRKSFSVPFGAQKETKTAYLKPNEPSNLEDTEFRLYQLVRHPSFGEGTIRNFEGEGAAMRVEVKFDTVGTKWLVLQFAKLEAMH